MALTVSIPTPTLTGAKTYLVAIGTLVFAGLSYWKGTMDLNQAISCGLGASGLAALRSALTTVRGQMLDDAIALALKVPPQGTNQGASP